MQKHIESIPKEAMEALTNAPWPGNIRELENFIERAVILSQGSELRVPLKELKRSSAVSTSGSTFEEAERQAIVEALKTARGKNLGTRRRSGAPGTKTHNAAEQDAQAGNCTYSCRHSTSLRSKLATSVAP